MSLKGHKIGYDHLAFCLSSQRQIPTLIIYESNLPGAYILRALVEADLCSHQCSLREVYAFGIERREKT